MVVFGIPNSVPPIESFNIQYPFLGGSFIRGSTVDKFINCLFQHHAEVQTSPSILHKNEVAVGTYCRLAMGSAKERPANCDRKQSCFCYDTIQIMYSHPAVECRVQGTCMHMQHRGSIDLE